MNLVRQNRNRSNTSVAFNVCGCFFIENLYMSNVQTINKAFEEWVVFLAFYLTCHWHKASGKEVRQLSDAGFQKLASWMQAQPFTREVLLLSWSVVKASYALCISVRLGGIASEQSQRKQRLRLFERLLGSVCNQWTTEACCFRRRTTL